MSAAEKIIITSEPLLLGVLASDFRHALKRAGAVVSFTGLVRDYVDTADPDMTVCELTLQHYEGFTQSQITEMIEMVFARFDIEDIKIAHRIGTIKAGEPVVWLATAAAHRRAAFQATDYLMDYLKTSAPFWKKERRGDKEVWIEPKSEDYADRARWAEKESR